MCVVLTLKHRITGIPFDVPSTIKGINAFGGSAPLNNIKIVGSGGSGGNQFVRSPLTTTLQNPSNISLVTNNVALPVFFKDVEVVLAASFRDYPFVDLFSHRN